MMIDQLTRAIEARPEPTPEQYEAAAVYVTRHAPDLLEMLDLPFGGIR